jgi:hypothetical protein
MIQRVRAPGGTSRPTVAGNGAKIAQRIICSPALSYVPDLPPSPFAGTGVPPMKEDDNGSC